MVLAYGHNKQSSLFIRTIECVSYMSSYFSFLLFVELMALGHIQFVLITLIPGDNFQSPEVYVSPAPLIIRLELIWLTFRTVCGHHENAD